MDNKDTQRPPLLLTVREVADLLRVHQRTAYRLIIDGRIKAIKIGSQWRVTEPALMEFINGGWRESAESSRQEQARDKGTSGPEQLKLPLD
ncbi:helix-turn-helix domain-containing protein [Pseudodesulfovibrio sp. F-1]|uniref:Helix-turn-helix domain-containing protein n=1 Tax=Pseudodesulfovibrio alkaliphilus TaxID=2661613 RepID=A0A7K1KNG4_9BACT|nr:helix-turn-helix domain-containing protein [Pseudodesulfovibrio alkaliphilus]MUM77624.1 helix-turn-helix domain-containing protein [Pseudodesulfovibrio alkaliphilus]